MKKKKKEDSIVTWLKGERKAESIPKNKKGEPQDPIAYKIKQKIKKWGF
jgi:hypothetical protein